MSDESTKPSGTSRVRVFTFAPDWGLPTVGPFGKQLYARGIARHPPELIVQKGRADLDALSVVLEERQFLVTERPTSVDTAVFGLVAPVVYWPMETPVGAYARSLPNVKAYCDRMRERCFRQPEPRAVPGS